MSGKRSTLGTTDITQLVFLVDKYNQRKVDVDATLEKIGRTREEILAEVWMTGTVEQRIKQSLNRRIEIAKSGKMFGRHKGRV